MTNYQKRKEKNDEYRSKIMRFTFQLSLGDGEVRDWFEQQPEKGAYLKDLMLRCTPIKSDYQFYIYCYQRKPFEKAQKEQQKSDRLAAKKRAEPER